MWSKILLLSILSLTSICANSTCLNQIRQSMLDSRIGLGRPGSSDKVESFVARRLLTYERKAKLEIGIRRTDTKLNGEKSHYLSERLLEALSLKSLPGKINDLLEAYWNNHNLISFQKEWFESLYRQAIFETYAKASPKLIEKFEDRIFLPEKILIEVLLSRLKETGLDTKKPERVWTQLSPSNFGDLLLNRKVIIDDGFRGSSHGHLIHLMQMDMLRFLAVKEGIPVSVVGDTVEFMGRNQQFLVEDFYFQPLRGTWDVLFDSREKDFSSPELLNSVIETALGWNRF